MKYYIAGLIVALLAMRALWLLGSIQDDKKNWRKQYRPLPRVTKKKAYWLKRWKP